MLTTSEERSTIRQLLGHPLKATTEDFILRLLSDAETAEAKVDQVFKRNLELKRAAEVWQETAMQNQRNADYYRSLVVKIGELFGDAAYIQDDGGRSEDILCAKVPELVQEMVALQKVLQRVCVAAHAWMYGGFWCQNCSKVEVEKQNAFCPACLDLLKRTAKENPNAKPDPEPADAGPHGLAGPDPA